jgi:hypothetical protein
MIDARYIGKRRSARVRRKMWETMGSVASNPGLLAVRLARPLAAARLP